jgi:catalase
MPKTPKTPKTGTTPGTAKGGKIPAAVVSSSRSSISGPSLPADPALADSSDAAVAKYTAQGLMATELAANDSGSTLSEINASAKLGLEVPVGKNANVQPLSAHRADSTGRTLTTNQGVPVADNQHSLKAGLRGPALLEDFILREKITHFDHERIPERIVHARGSAAHGVLRELRPLTDLTRAAPFAEAGKRTPVFVRFSTVAGERGSTDTVRDVRGFAVKFYTDEGNWDLVGNNIPVFFIQDAMKFPDLVHA